MTITATVEKKEMIKQEINIELPHYSKSKYGNIMHRINKDRSVTCVMVDDDYSCIVNRSPESSGYGREILEAYNDDPAGEQEFINALEKVRAQMQKSMTC